MTGLGIHALTLPLVGLHSALTHHELMGVLEIARILGNSYRLASSERGSNLLYCRFAFNFCRTVVAGVAR